MWETSWRKILRKLDETKIELFGHLNKSQTLHIIRITFNNGGFAAGPGRLVRVKGE